VSDEDTSGKGKKEKHFTSAQEEYRREMVGRSWCSLYLNLLSMGYNAPRGEYQVTLHHVQLRAGKETR
jgi:hypothetical protein